MCSFINNTFRKQLGLIVGISLPLAISGCGNTVTPEGNVEETPPAAPSNVSPLSEYLGDLWGTNLAPAEQQRQQTQKDLHREELIAECMQSQGFEFIPTQVVVTDGLLNDDNYRPWDRDWVAQYGFALIHNPWENAGDAEPVEITPDPNQEYLAGLSDAEREAYYLALFGVHDEELPPGVISEDGQILDMEAYRANQGCWGVAQQQIDATTVDGLFNSAEFAPLFDAIGQMRNSVYEIPEFLVIDDDWSNCMADAGFPGIYHQGRVQDQLIEAYNPIIANWDWDHGEPTAANSPEIAALGEQEIEIALADFDCRESVQWESRRQHLINDTERQFIQDHQAELTALRDAVEQRRAD